MAAPHFDPPLPTASFFDIYTDGAPTRSNNPANLPSGGCNFVDLAPGANGSKCGCRHFWSRFAVGRAFADNLGSDNSAYCMCSHHACFHDYDRGTEPATPVAAVPGQENEKPRGNREPLSPVVQDIGSFRLPGGTVGPVDVAPPQSAMHAPLKRTEDIRSRPMDHFSLPAESSLQDTLSWGELVQSQSANAALPPIPQQCLMPASQPSSTTSSSQARYLRPFAGKGLATLSGVGQAKPRSLLQGAPRTSEGPDAQQTREDDVSATATITHSSSLPDDAQRLSSPPGNREPSSQIFGAPSRDTFLHLSDTVQGHEQRLDKLENVSFTAGGHDECHEKHDVVDLRVTHLEARVDEVEKLMNDTSSVAGARRGADESTNSVVSVSTSTTARGLESMEIYEHIRSLESQVRQLRSYTPSHMHPWEIEVVFLPFPLRRLWQESHDFKAEPSSDMDEWTQMPNTNSTATMRAQSPFCGDWSEPGLDYSWLLPRACMAQGLLDKRLRSRGLVRSVSIKAPDARSVQAAVQLAFGATLSDMAATMPPATSRHKTVAAKITQFFGLQQSLVPLRKIHKDDRLRFLSPAEMVTPALWDVAFLNSVVMRASQPRLFVTQPEAYLQDLHAYDAGWTWQKVRELSRVYPDTQTSQEVPEADALEEYWAWNERLDEPHSLQSSMSSQQAKQPVPPSPSQHFFTIKSSMRASSPRVSRGHPHARSKERIQQPSRPLHVRTTSMPPIAPTPFSPSGIKRRVASYGQKHPSGPSSPLVQVRSSPAPGAAAALAQKRRQTRSPSRPRNTPRWTTSPSPGLAMFPSDDVRLQARGVTPLYYATPFSNAPMAEARSRVSGAIGDAYASEDDEDYKDLHDSGTTNIYEDDDDDDDDASGMSVELVAHHIIRQGNDSQPRQPEDEPWPGIEDQDHVSDGENIDPLFSPVLDDATSVASSQPSEYPSTQRGWEIPGTNNDGAGFHIHEDVQMPDSQ